MRIFITLSLLASSFMLCAQSKTTEKLKEQFPDAQNFFFYNNTLRMINQKEDQDFDALIKDIEKMKLVLIKKDSKNFNYAKLTKEYKAEAFEEIMTSRMEGKNFDVFIREKDGKTKAMLVLVNDSENLFVLDILGSLALDKIGKLYTVMDQSSDIGKRIQQFVKKDDSKK